MSAADARIPLPLCRLEGRTCAACCWGRDVSPATLRRQLRRQSCLFHAYIPAGAAPSWLRLLWHELLSRRGLDLLWSVLLWLPGVGDWLRPRLQRRTVCAFLGYDDPSETRVGCMLHPTRWQGREVRAQTAFALLSGMACGSPDYYCLAAHRFALVPWREQARFLQHTAALDWYDYSRAASAYRPEKKPTHDHATIS